MTTLVIVRGPSGSGKTTVAESLVKCNGYSHYEADMYFIDDQGNYNWDGLMIANAHDWCRRMVEKDLKEGKNVVVANTFVRLWELKPYVKLAHRLGVGLHIVHCDGEFENVHGVPQEIVDRMRENMEDITQEIIERWQQEV